MRPSQCGVSRHVDLAQAGVEPEEGFGVLDRRRLGGADRHVPAPERHEEPVALVHDGLDVSVDLERQVGPGLREGDAHEHVARPEVHGDAVGAVDDDGVVDREAQGARRRTAGGDRPWTSPSSTKVSPRRTGRRP